MEHAPALVQGLAMARTEAVLLAACWAALLGVGVVHRFATWEATLWCAVLLTQSLPYLAAVFLSVVAALPARAAAPRRRAVRALAPARLLPLRAPAAAVSRRVRGDAEMTLKNG
jgi:hypothetical protein